MTRSVQKVKTGCITCKARRIKCDEARPYCARCVTTGRRCDGYVTPPSGAYSWAQLLSAKPSPETQPSVTPAEQRAMVFFNRVAAPGLGGSLMKSFWGTVVVQVASQEPVAKHAVLAVSSLYENFAARSRGDTTVKIGENRDAFAVRHYNEAIRLLRTTTDRALVLLVCAIFVCIELLRKNTKDAISHCKHGINILNEMHTESEFVRNHVKPAIQALSIIPYLYGADATTFPVLCTPGETTEYRFKNISEAHAGLVKVLVRLVRFVRTGIHESLRPGYAGPEPDAEWTRRSVLHDMECWLEGFSHLMTYRYVPANEWERNVARLLQMRWLVGKIMLMVGDADGESAYDDYVDEFQMIVDVATPAAAGDQGKGGGGGGLVDAGNSALELGFSSLLSYVVMKCRVFKLRMEAWELMKKLARPGGNIWSEDVTLALGRRIIELEHNVHLDEAEGCELHLEKHVAKVAGDSRVINFGVEVGETDCSLQTIQFNFLLRAGESREVLLKDEFVALESRTSLLKRGTRWAGVYKHR